MNKSLRRVAFLAALASLFLTSCKPDSADLLLINGVVHTMDAKGTLGQAVAIRDGKIVDVGTTDDLVFRYSCDSILDVEGRAIYPGFFDAHCHFLGLARMRNHVDLVGTASFGEVMQRVDSFAKTLGPNDWLIGRGWDQNDWREKDFPSNQQLSERYPDRPVLLHRIDGHAALANRTALERAGIDRYTRVDGGLVEIGADGEPTGILVDNAVSLVEKVVPPVSTETLVKLILDLQKDCFAVGLTTVDDAGLSFEDIFLLDSLQKKGLLKMRVYAMAEPSPKNLDHFLAKGPLKTDYLHVCSFKAYADGALGSRGAALLEPYKDDPGNYGLMLHGPEYFEDLAARLYAAKFQLNTHCIGDSAVRMITRIYSNHLQKTDDRRWRIEHVQVVHPDDFARFKEYKIWPSVQPTHAISDQPWAEDRIGKVRIKGAYAYKTLYEQFHKIAFGSDFPVESIDPMNGYHAAITRTDAKGNPYGGFLPEQAVGRDTALRAMTIWAAESNFEEKEKGSIEKGKFADLVVMDRDILFTPADSIQHAKVLYTIVGGKVVFRYQNAEPK